MLWQTHAKVLSSPCAGLGKSGNGELNRSARPAFNHSGEKELTMLRTLRRVLSGCVVALGCAALAAPAAAQPNNPAVIYRLSSDASLVRGCFPPCLCPLTLVGQVRGTFILTPVPSGSNVLDYRVDDVNWLVDAAEAEWRITGSGTLRRAGVPTAEAQRLELDLKINDEPITHFDSGWISPSVEFPAINIAVTMNGGVCFDTQIDVIAAPVPASQLLHYHVGGGSTFQQGCFDPCDCPLLKPRPIRGSFVLVPIPQGSSSAGVEYAVVKMRLNHLVSASPSVLRLLYTGSGFYRRNLQGPWGNQPPGQQMFLDLRSTNTGATEHFDSGIVQTAVPFPQIDITMSINGMVCFDKVIHLRAAPATP
jgi:hypothetical protein